MKWNLHRVAGPFRTSFELGCLMSELSQWRAAHPPTVFNDFYQPRWDYNRRYSLYEAVAQHENLTETPLDYFEFGVGSGASIKWWMNKNTAASSRFFGFDTFEGLPENWGPFHRGAMAHSLELLNIHDPRASFYKGLFQETLLPFLSQYEAAGNRKLIHIDSDLFSSALFALTQLYRFLKPGDLLFFDEFAVPQHEFRAFKLFTESFYIPYDVLGAANNYLFVAIKLKES